MVQRCEERIIITRGDHIAVVELGSAVEDQTTSCEVVDNGEDHVAFLDETRHRDDSLCVVLLLVTLLLNYPLADRNDRGVGVLRGEIHGE